MSNENIKIEGHLLALSPIAHNGNEKSGNTVTLRRIYMITAEGKRKNIPYLEGNAVRGMLRRLLMGDFFHQLKIPAHTLNPRVYHMFFTGGNLEQVSKGQGEIDIQLRQKMAELLPPIAVLGTSYLNQAIPGNLIVSKMYPICKELQHFYPLYGIKENEYPQFNVEQLTSESFQTRRDDRKVQTVNSKNPMQMKIETEVFIPGTNFMHYFILSNLTKVELSMFHHLMHLWKQKPVFGGKSAIGNGQMELNYDLSKLPSSDLYFKFVQDNRTKILALITEIENEGINRTQKRPKKTSAAKPTKNKIKADQKIAASILEK